MTNISIKELENCDLISTLKSKLIFHFLYFRLKSRYMSVALRSSSRGTLGTLRRTASLEYFLDCDKECVVEEVELTTPPPRPLTVTSHTIQANHVNKVSSMCSKNRPKNIVSRIGKICWT